MRSFPHGVVPILLACLIVYAFPSCVEISNEPINISDDPDQPKEQPKDPVRTDPEEEHKGEVDDYFIEDLPSSEELDFSHVERIPCDTTQADHLCYDKTTFIEQHGDRIEAYRAWHTARYSEGEDLTEEKRTALENAMNAVVDATHVILGKCNYYKDADGQTRVHCPDELHGVYACPHMWFHPEMFVMGGVRTHPDEDPICYEHIIPEPGGFCNIMGCSGEQVCTGVFSLNPKTDDAEASSGFMMVRNALPVCVNPETCLSLREGHGLSADSSCYFTDRTTLLPDAPSIEHVSDCDAIEKGMCAVNCPCEEPDARCVLISQERNVGVCSTNKCQSSQDCKSNETCIQGRGYRVLPAYDWLLTDNYGHGDKAFEDCVDKTICESWRDLHGLSNVIYNRMADCNAN